MPLLFFAGAMSRRGGSAASTKAAAWPPHSKGTWAVLVRESSRESAQGMQACEIELLPQKK